MMQKTLRRLAVKRFLGRVAAIAVVFVLLGVFASHSGAQRSADQATPADYVPGELLVKFVPGTPAALEENARVLLGVRHLKTFHEIGVRHWQLGRGVSVEQALTILSRVPFREQIVYAEPNYIVYALDFPNDPQRGDLWGLHNLGQTAGTPDADIDAPEAWTVQKGSTSVIVGVIDTGIDYNHPDLAANIWKNPAEEGGLPGVDDDGNGYVDDIYGWDFVNEDNDPMDGNRHGTHVAGTIGAVGSNNLGVVGVNWAVKLMALKFLSDGGSGSNADAIEAVLYAKGFNVPITNNSWGGGNRSRALQDAIASSDALFVAAAGNSATSAKMYPAAYDLDNILSVGATDHNDNLASFSNYSPTWVDLAAPGVNILSTLPGNKYGPLSGTSMATPHVSGAAALVTSQFTGFGPTQIKSQLMSTVDVKASLAGTSVTGGRLNAARAVGIGPGPSSDVIAPAQVTDLAASGSAPESITVAWTATGDDGTTGNAYLYDVRYSTEPLTEANWGTATPASGEPLPASPGMLEAFTVGGLLGGTTYYLGVKVTDEAGNFSPLSNVVSAATQTSAWTIEIVSATGVGFYNSLAYDPSGNPAIAASSGGGLQFARKSGGSWTIRTVDSSSAGEGVSIAYDPTDGRASLSYAWGKLKFAHANDAVGTSWTIQTVEKSNAYNDVTSLAYDPSGKAAISYRVTGQRAALKLARWTGSAWSLQVVEAGAGARYNSLAFDPATGYPTIAYSDDIDRDNWLDTVKFAWWDGARWQIEIVETGPVGYGVFASLAFDPATGQPCVAHSRIRYACRTGPNTWQTEDAPAGNYESLKFNSSGEALMSHTTTGYAGLKFSRRTVSGWQTEGVSSGTPNWITSLKLDLGTHIPSISYQESETGNLKYARRSGP